MLIVTLVTLVLAGVVVLLLVDTDLLLPVALVLTALVPIGWTGAPEALTVASPGAITVVVWLLRRRPGERRPSVLVAVVALALIAWIAVETVVSISAVRAVGWSAAFLVLVVSPVLARSINELEARRIMTTWILLMVGLTVFGCVERVLEMNPVYGGLFLEGESPIVQHWSSYRITTTLGHPLSNSLFFAIGVTLATGRFVREGSRWSLLGAAIGLVGLLLTVSRGGLIATAAGVALVLAAPGANGHEHAALSGTHRRRLVGLLTLAAGGLVIIASPEFQERQQSWSGIASAQQRSEIGPIVLRASESMHWLGSGPGTSNALLRALGTPIIVENSYYQLLLSLGVPGLGLFVLLIGTVAALGVLRGNSGAVGGLAALCVAAGGFNWIEADRPSMLYLGLLAAMAMQNARPPVDRGAQEAVKVEPMKAKSRVINGSEPCTKAELR